MLNSHQILSASYSDILFQDRNKLYGAYQLRKQYPAHLMWSVGIMMALVAIAIVVSLLTKPLQNVAPVFIDLSTGIHLIKEPIILPKVVPPQPPPSSPQNLRTEIFTPPLIEKDPPADRVVPTVDDLSNAIISNIKRDGEDIGHIVAPPQTPIVSATPAVQQVVPVEREDDNALHVVVDEEASFEGGIRQWIRYLQKNLRYPDDAIEQSIQGSIIVQFIIDKEGNISEVKALNDLGSGLSQEAVRIIERGPKWVPAKRNGKKVKSLKRQKIGFVLHD